MADYGISRKSTFVNPYSFVPIQATGNKKISRRQSVDEYYQGEALFTGVLHCKMTTHTPLAIPDVEKKEARETDADQKLEEKDKRRDHYKYPFYQINGRYAVQGSSIRGMIRSAYETATDSCFVTMKDEEWLSERVPAGEPYKEAVLVRDKNGWKIYKATRYRIAVEKGKHNQPVNYRVAEQNGVRVLKHIGSGEIFRNGDLVDIVSHNRTVMVGGKFNKKPVEQPIVDTMSVATPKSNRRYVVYIGEPIDNKKFESVFRIDTVMHFDTEQVKAAMVCLENTVSLYQDSSVNRNLGEKGNTGYANYAEAKDRGFIPVWYNAKDSHTLHLSTACIGRKTFHNKVNDLVGVKYQPCTHRIELCPACMLFGMAKDEAFGGRVRFSDALTDRKDSLIPEVTLQELGSPRTGYRPFYSLKGLDYDAAGANIAGRKYYWHISKAENQASVYSTQEKTNRNATMDLIGPNTEFEFDVYYDGITEEQLNELRWILTLGENRADSKQMHKLGHGKPLGLGSVKIQITEEKQRVFSLENGYSFTSVSNSTSVNKPARVSDKLFNQLKIITDYHLMDSEEVRYPYVEIADHLEYDRNRKLDDNVLANHQWFTSNKGRRKDDPKPRYCLKTVDSSSGGAYRMCTYEVQSIDSRKDYAKEEMPSQNKDKAGFNKGQKSNTAKEYKGKIKFYKKADDFGYIIGDNGREYRYTKAVFPGLIINKTRNHEAVKFRVEKINEKFTVTHVEYAD